MLQPVGQALEIGGERRKLLHRLRVPLGRHSDIVAARTDIDSGGVQVDGLQRLFVDLLPEDRIDLYSHFFLGWQRHALLFFLLQDHDRMLFVEEENDQSEREFSR